MTMIAGAIRFVRLDSESLWIDELAQVATYKLPLSYIVGEAATTTQPPLDYWIGAGLDRLGLANSDWWVRVPAVLFGTLGVALLGWWGWRVHSAVAGITAAMLLAVCPLHVAMSQEARPYTIFVFLAMFSVALFDAAWRRNRPGWWALFGITFLGLLLSRWVEPHFITLGLLIYCGIGWLRGRRTPADGNEGQRTGARISWAATIMLLAYAIYNPIFGIILDHNRRAIDPQVGAWWERFLQNIAEASVAIVRGYSASTLRAVEASEWPVFLAVIFTTAGLAGFCVRTWRRRDSTGGAFLATIAAFPLLFGLTYARMTGTPAKPQYLLLLSIPMLLGIGVCAESIRRIVVPAGRRSAWATFAAVVLIPLAPMAWGSYRSITEIEKCDWRGVMHYLRDHSEPGDAFASAGSDTVPPTYRAYVPRIGRYFEPDSHFFATDADASLAAIDKAPWTRTDNRVWIVCYNDRMYLGYDLLPAPTEIVPDIQIHPFHGLFIVEIRGNKPAVERLMHGLAFVSQNLPSNSSFASANILRGRYLLEHGQLGEAGASFEEARRQCAGPQELLALEQTYLPNQARSVRATKESENLPQPIPQPTP
ncbi:MAG: glycosyltransferase family 39 protein [Planctomycetes bacterium]|nr:glycosyltransferase family 39 protein [Planctomycetota bacterium]MBI3833944.1 glycosyltransferase family 39 protein [Planctomycetota bacterium]